MGFLAWVAFLTLAVVFASRVIYASITIVKDQNERVKHEDGSVESAKGSSEAQVSVQGKHLEQVKAGTDEDDKKEI